MAVVIDLQGEIGWEIRPKNIAIKLSHTKGEDIIVRLSTVGGDVFDGADIVNMFLDFRRDNPDVKMDLEVKAIAASMGSALMSAGIWDSIGVSRVTAFMMHSPSTFVFGNSEDLQSAMDFLNGLSSMYEGLYSEQSGKTIAEIVPLMKAETWYFGQQIIDEGFADKIITMEDEGGEPLLIEPENIDTNIILFEMKKKRESLMSKQKEKAKDENFDSKRAVACLREKPPEIIIETPVKADDIKPAPVGNLKTEVPMNEEELKKDNPELYKSLMKKGADSERENNTARVTALTAIKGQEEYKDIPEIGMVIDKAIEGNTSVDAVQPLIMAAMLKIMKDPARMAKIESPGSITPGDGEDLTTETKKNAEV